jgi:hypothetical protein
MIGGRTHVAREAATVVLIEATTERYTYALKTNRASWLVPRKKSLALRSFPPL